jgi:hypothetical protein
VEVADDRRVVEEGLWVGRRVGSQVRLEDENEMCLGAFL